MGCFKSDALKSFGTLGLSDLAKGSFNPLNLGKSGFAWTDKTLGTGNTMQDIGKAIDLVALLYGAKEAGGSLAGYFGSAGAGAGTAAGAGTGAVTGATEVAASAPSISTGITEALAGSSAPATITGTTAGSVVPATITGAAEVAPFSASSIAPALTAETGTGAGLSLGTAAGTGSSYAIPAELAADMGAAGITGASETPSVLPMESFNMANPANASTTTYGAQTTPGGWTSISDNPITNTIMNNKKTSAQVGLNLFNSYNKSKMAGDYNKAQQKSYQDWLNTLNPPESVKAARYNTLADKAITQSNLSRRMLENNMASRGIRGKGVASPSGDLSEATRSSLNDAYNQIYGTYNVPGSAGPVNYSPSTMNYIAGDSTATANYLLPLLSMLSQYNVPATV